MKKILLIMFVLLFPVVIFAQSNTIKADEENYMLLKVGTYERLKLPKGITRGEVTWESSDSSIADVDEDGVVNAKTPGEATVKAVVSEGNKVVYKIEVASTFSYYMHLALDWAAENIMVIVLATVLILIFIFLKLAY